MTGIICDVVDDQGSRQEERISNNDLLRVRLGLTTDKCTNLMLKRVNNAMRRLGWEKPADPIRIPGQGKVRGFCRPYPPPKGDQ